MKCVCVSCFDHYSTRFKYVIDFFRRKGFETYYIITDYLHFEKKYEKVDYPGVIHVHVPEYAKNMSPRRLYSHYVFAKGVYKELEMIQPDFIYCMYPPNMLVKKCGQYKKKHPEIGLVFDSYDSWPESMPMKSPLLSLPFRIWKNIRDSYIEYADKLITVSEFGVKQLLEAYPGMDVGLLYPRLEERPEIRYCSDTSDGIKFCYLGNINYITDIELIIRLLSTISSQVKVKLHHIGGGLNLGEFKSRLEKSGIEFIAHGAIFDAEKKEEVFSQCNLGINLPRKEIKSTMALKSIEYMRSGLPFINSGIGDNWEIVEHYSIGFNCSSENVSELANEIINLKTADYEKMHKNVVACYRKLFGNPDYDHIFGGVPNISCKE